MDARDFYDELGSDYDLMVSWDERLRREEAFFRKVFAAHGVHRVLDAACGTGMHAVRFAGWGLGVSAADISPAMAGRAAENARQAGAVVDARVAAFGGLRGVFGGSFDAVTCLGNSLPHLLDDESLEAALSDMAAVLRPGGLLVVQNRNYDRILKDRERFMPVTARPSGDGEVLFLRITDFRGGDELGFSILTIRRAGGAWSLSAKTTPLRGLRRETIERALAQAGFRRVQFHGSYRFDDFDAHGTGDLVAVAER